MKIERMTRLGLLGLVGVKFAYQMFFFNLAGEEIGHDLRAVARIADQDEVLPFGNVDFLFHEDPDGWDLDGDHEIDVAGAEADWVFPAEVDTDVTLLVVDQLGCVGTDTLHLQVALRRPLPPRSASRPCTGSAQPRGSPGRTWS